MIAAKGSIAQGVYKLRALLVSPFIRYVFLFTFKPLYSLCFFIYTEELRKVLSRSMTEYVLRCHVQDLTHPLFN